MKRPTPKRLANIFLRAGTCLLGGFLAYAAYANIAAAQFTGPGCTAGDCSGAIGINSVNDVSFGTSTATTTSKVYIVTSTANNTYGLQVRGKIYSSSGGFVFPDGSIQTTASSGSSTVYAANVSNVGGAFGTNTGGGNYSFPSQLSLGTTTAPSQTPLYIATGAPRIGLYDTDLAMSASNPAWIVRGHSAGTFNIQSTADYSTITDRLVINASGYVGIGTTTPATFLHLSGANVNNRGQLTITSSDYAQIAFYGNSTFGGQVYYDVSGNFMSVGGIAASSQLVFRTGTGSERMRIDASGNVGIGTTTPASLLTVAGAIRSSATGFIFPDGTTQATASTGGGGWTDGGTNVYTTTITDNVGIGITAPAARLDIDAGSNTTGIRLRGTSETAQIGDIFVNAGGALVLSTANTGDAMSYIEVDGEDDSYGFIIRDSNTGSSVYSNLFMNDAAVDYLNITVNAANSTPGLVVTDSDTVGVGTVTTAAAVKLEVAGRIMATNAEAYNIGVRYSASAGNFWLGATNAVYPDLLFSNSDGAEKVRITGNTGRVGIGTSTPAALLNVFGSNEIARFSGGTVPYITVGNGTTATTGGYMQWDDTNDRLNISPHAITAMSITSAGLVGIGTSTPTALLSVGTSTSGLVATFGGGSGKINVGTIDPLYTIGGKRYATYLPAMTGQKEETTGNIQCPISNNQCKYVVDFKKLKEGSDLWLFGKVANLVKDRGNFENMNVMLTPAFDGRAWYEKDIASRTITIYAQPTNYKLQTTNSLEISYRLTAPRFDSANWSNRATETEEGFNLDKLIK